MEEQGRKKGFSKNFLAGLLVLAIILSVIGTYMSIVHADYSQVRSGSQNGGGHVGVYVIPSGQAHIGLVVYNPQENNKKEE